MKAYVGLTCKPGAYGRVLKELLDLKIHSGDIFLLFGPVDILVQLTGLTSLDEFKEKWFNPIRMIGADEELITRTLTLIVITEGPEFVEEPFAFIFLHAKIQHLEDVRQSLQSIAGVLSADTVFGPYDVICPVRARDRVDLERIIATIHNNIPEIVGTQTAVLALMRV